MLTLYHQPGACSLASHILLEESGLAYETRHIDLAAGEHLSPDYLSINPKGRVPALAHDGRIVTESPAILSYVAGLAPEAQFLPDELVARTRVLEWMNWLSGSLHAVAFAALIHPDWFADSESAQAEVRARGQRSVVEHMEAIDAKLAGCQWAVDNRFSLVDPYLLVFYTWGIRLGLTMATYGHYREHALRMIARPAVAKVLAEEGVVPIE